MTPRDVITYTDEAWNNPNIINKKTDTQAHFKIVDGTAYLFFSPTQTYRDVLTDLDAWYGDGFHAGFWKAFSSVEEELFELIANGDFTKIIMGGHSLGGAIAMIAVTQFGLYLHHHKGIGIQCFTTGAPAPFESSQSAPFFNAMWGKYITRYELAGDLVPKLAPWGAHIGHQVTLGKWGWKERLGLKWQNHYPIEYMKFDKEGV